MLSNVVSFFRKPKLIDLEAYTTPEVPAVEYALDMEWEETVALPEDGSILIDGNGKVFTMTPTGRWVHSPEIKDIRINVHY